MATATLLAPILDIERLDLLDRERLEALTRRMVHDALAPEWMRTDAVAGHARQFLVDVTPGAAAPSRGWFGRGGSERPTDTLPAPVDRPRARRRPPETRRYFSYVLLDLSTVDPDLADESLVECLAVAREAGLEPTFEEVARKELAMNGRAWDAIRRRSTGRRHQLATADAVPTALTAPTAPESTPGAAPAPASEAPDAPDTDTESAREAPDTEPAP